MNKSTLTIAIALCCFSLPALLPAAVTFTVVYEPGSQWLTHPNATQAQANLQQLLDDVGALIEDTATIQVYVTDDATGGVYASASSAPGDYVTLSGKPGQYYATGVWIKINDGVDLNGVSSDMTINWNWDVAGLYGGDINQFLDNIRGLARHEVIHPLGMTSRLNHPGDVGMQSSATVHDSCLIDAAGAGLLGAYNPATRQFIVNNYSLAPNLGGGQDLSNIRFQARRADGSIQHQQISSTSPDTIDFSHVPIVSYVYARPGGGANWGVIVDEDLNYLRGLGYRIVGDPIQMVATRAAVDRDLKKTVRFRIKLVKQSIRTARKENQRRKLKSLIRKLKHLKQRLRRLSS